ncbi:DNA cytosine methyltransferase [Pseudomonas aeruginosa]|uniref:DNA (cytosine-5-)-methyltransferase n=1 Tax=Ectopseudomonas oleovorans TaxID=301 RepID=A0A379PIJ7_ECTOL|nr:DNA cytosine methyltransferase [Pseudomonas oleovorans]MCS7527241.1 DNA cytosine methyltransferase [Pseudomonas aeruginosa]MCS8510071.1 DNA cytosine methyltransferase [Pseudomonas aeruginosa]MCS8541421.1 DNA cytosine methyltransferase [Pseudomonas aeruginosa]MCT0600567.1 DNA cytosine methyltransferase [Pseudomonas aeruginosa]OWK40018.1 Modification methylase HhaI [Pseudomonas oleovorans subsp. oleovorans]
MSTTVINTLVSESRSVPRIWLEGQHLAHAGVEIGVQYMLNVCEKLRRIELRPAPQGFSGKTVSVSKRTRNERVYPLIEVRDSIIAALFEVGTKLRVAINNGRIVISMSHIAMRVQERVNRFLNKLKTGEPLSVASLFHGGGVLDSALHEGFQRTGLASYVKIAVELEGDYIDASLRNNPELWRDDSIVINGDIRDVNILGNGVPQTDILVGGVPCTGASRSGAAKNNLSCAEEHSTAGALFFDYLEWVKVLNPALVILENVVEYASTAAMIVIRSVLSHLGYQLSETVLDGHSLGSLEKRKRLCLVATTPGVCEPVDFNQLVPVRQREEKIADVLEVIPADSGMWKTYDYLADKELRDKAAGKGFARQLLIGGEDGCGVIGRGYAKARSTEPFIVAPHDPRLSRLMTPAEHARVKTIPEKLIEGLGSTRAHEVLGQSVIYCAFVAVGVLMAKTVTGLVSSLTKPQPVNREEKAASARKPVPANNKQLKECPATLPLFALTA